MKLIGTQILGTSSKTIREFVCDGCGYNVKEIEIVVPFGPQKGQKIQTIANCTCATNELSRQVKRELEEDRRKKMFSINSIISEELKQARFDNFDPETESQMQGLRDSKAYAERFLKNKPENMVFSGPYGVGKSHLSYSIVREVFKKGNTCIFINVPKLLSKIRISYKEKSAYSEADLLKAMVDVNLLVLDEIGRGYDPNGWAEGKLFEIIDERAGKHTIYTTNYSANELADKIGGHNVSRMLKNAITVKMQGRDRRVPI